MEQHFLKQMAHVNYDDPFRSVQIASINNQAKKERDILECLKNKEKNQKRETK